MTGVYGYKDNNHNVTALHKLENLLNELLKEGAQQLLAQAIEAEVNPCSILFT
ncbi:hypothetical protein [Candidatus Enterovibrio escicola]|uniref:hypothetical protein n=1 Tax=Candidatus Enterovibrio escicola TaxID=1927127 RepID=UPI0016805955|nr:hypothetical protein [Candidatus Enterovibrio escacola]